jgi:predicted DNA-binding protein (UPF0278 family)
MIETKTMTTKTCDLCTKEVQGFAQATECSTEVISVLERNIWYGGPMRYDICTDCSNKILEFLYKTFPNRLAGRDPRPKPK